MASNKKFIKLGEKASLFSDPSSGLKVLPGNVIELKASHKASKRVTKALRHGHLEYASPEEIEAGSTNVSNDVDDKSSKKTTEDWKDNVEYETSNLKRLKKDQLIELAIYNESELSANELDELNKDDIIEEILELIEEEE